VSLPRASQARPYYQAARQRFEDARFLFEAARTTGAIYLAGYCVECMLKALILSTLSDPQRNEILKTFRSSKAHDFDWLKGCYFANGGPPYPKSIAQAFSYVNTWAVEIRYKAGSSKYGDAKAFLDSAQHIMTWADGRM
jgi:hypothetical protein